MNNCLYLKPYFCLFTLSRKLRPSKHQPNSLILKSWIVYYSLPVIFLNQGQSMQSRKYKMGVQVFIFYFHKIRELGLDVWFIDFLLRVKKNKIRSF